MLVRQNHRHSTIGRAAQWHVVHAFLHDEQLRVMRIVLPAGKELPEYAIEGPMTMHGLEGAGDVTAHSSCKIMRTGDFM